MKRDKILENKETVMKEKECLQKQTRTEKLSPDGKPPVVVSFSVGQVVKKGRSTFVITKVNKNTLRLRQVWDRAVRGTNMRRLTFGDFFTADISEVRK